ncbi:MAG: hypothetical protein N838_00160 [Thiohalocapsa sp. PB-PSB1]|jgi:uncharacterized membrane protein YuzA (DUF378 family)|nr:MAG: hypothetical protein N838_00160 [Thiohalocapsa sp. PB-PSB1]
MMISREGVQIAIAALGFVFAVGTFFAGKLLGLSDEFGLVLAFIIGFVTLQVQILYTLVGLRDAINNISPVFHLPREIQDYIHSMVRVTSDLRLPGRRDIDSEFAHSIYRTAYEMLDAILKGTDFTYDNIYKANLIALSCLRRCMKTIFFNVRPKQRNKFE